MSKQERRVCNYPECTEAFPNHYSSGVGKHAYGWLQQIDNVVWCPNHLPAWVFEWRRAKAIDPRGKEEGPKR